MRALLLGLVLLGSSSCHTVAAQAWAGSLLDAPGRVAEDPPKDPPGIPLPFGCILIQGIIICH